MFPKMSVSIDLFSLILLGTYPTTLVSISYPVVFWKSLSLDGVSVSREKEGGKKQGAEAKKYLAE